MSTITLPIAELKPALTGLAKILNRHASLPVLNHIKIERTGDGWIALTATDLDHFATVRLEQPAQGGPLALLVPYEQLQRTVKACTKDESIFVGPGPKNTGFLQYGLGAQLAEIEFESLPIAEFPETPHIHGNAITLPENVRSSIHDALECASTNEHRLILNRVCLDVSKRETHYVVGTDGHHLFSSNSFNLPLKDSLILPSHRFLGWKEFNADGEWQLRIGDATKDKAAPFQITSRRWRFIGWPREGNYPNWRGQIPNATSARTTLVLDPQKLLEIGQTILRMPNHDEVNHTIGIEWKNAKLYLLGKAPNAAEWMRVPIEAQGMGPEITTFLNRHFLTKALSFGLNAIGLIDSKSALRFHNEGRQMIVMPIRSDVGNPPPPTTPKPEATPAPSATAHQPAPNQPAANSSAAQPERNTMPKNPNGNGNHAETTEKSTLEKALDQIESVKGSHRDAIRGLNDLADTLRQIHRDQKSSEREVQTVRTTLAKLQSVRV